MSERPAVAPGSSRPVQHFVGPPAPVPRLRLIKVGGGSYSAELVEYSCKSIRVRHRRFLISIDLLFSYENAIFLHLVVVLKNLRRAYWKQ